MSPTLKIGYRVTLAVITDYIVEVPEAISVLDAHQTALGKLAMSPLSGAHIVSVKIEEV
jgi:hypothetical protein